MSLHEFFSGARRKAKAAVMQLFTPKEFQALLLFVGIGFAVLLFRGGKELFFTLYPPAIPNEVALREARNDSIFSALSRKVIEEDSLKFSIPEDSVLKKEKTSIASENKKGKDLPPHSIPINKADEDALQKLPGIGKVMAQRILLYRSKRGGFRDLREVMDIQGIGEKKFNKIAQYLRLN